ncbi:MAG: YfhO family protein [Candidatus Sericytochromatia bacterium]
MRTWQREHWLPPLILIALAGLLIGPVLLRGESFFYRDISIHYGPMTAYVRDQWLSGHWAFWNPLAFSGFDQLAGIEPPLFYPPMLLFLLPYPIALCLSLWLHYSLSGIGAWWLSRLWGASPPAALLGGVAFMLNGYVWEHSNLYPILFAIAWLPWLIGLCQHLLNGFEWRHFALLTLCSALFASTGRWDYLLFAGLFLALWGLAWLLLLPTAERRVLLRRLPAIALALAGGVGLLAIQILPTLLYMEGTRRAAHMSNLAAVSVWSLHPLQLIQLICQRFFGDVMQTHGLSPLLNDPSQPSLLIYSLYLGPGALWLAWRGCRHGEAHWRALLLPLGVFTLLAFGHHTPFYGLLYEWVPGFDFLRYPAKLMLIPLFCLALLAARGTDTLSSITKPWGLLGLTALLGLGTLVSWAGREQALQTLNPLLQTGWGYQLSQLDFVWQSTLTGTLLAGLWSGLLLWRPRPFLATALLSGELLLMAALNTPTLPQQELATLPPLAQYLQKHQDRESYFYSNRERQGPAAQRPGGLTQVGWESHWHSLFGNLPLGWGIAQAYGYYPAEPFELAYLAAALEDEIPGLRLDSPQKAALMRLMGIRHYLWHSANRQLSPPLAPDFQQVARDSVFGLELWEVAQKPRWLNFRTVPLWSPDATEWLRQVLLPQEHDLNGNAVALLDDPLLRESLAAYQLGDSAARPAELTLLESHGQGLSLRSRSETDGLVVLAQRYSSGWEAWVDDQPTPVLPANYTQMAIPVKAGTHTLNLRFTPPGLRQGAALSLMTLVLLLGGSWLSWRVQRRTAKVPQSPSGSSGFSST